MHYGVEFSGGTQLIAEFQKPAEIDKIRDAVEHGAPGRGDPDLRRRQAEQGAHPHRGRGPGERPRRPAPARSSSRSGRAYAANPVAESSSEIVGPVVGAELRQKAIILTVLGLAVPAHLHRVRFKGGVWGIAAAVAALHDVLVCLGFLAFFRSRSRST